VSGGVVVEYTSQAGGLLDAHDRAARAEIARRIAALQGLDYAGEYDSAARYPGRVYFVPSDTLVGRACASQLGIRSERDLFGGVVPAAILATKAITHPLVDPAALPPEGWSSAFPGTVRNAVLPGFSIFTPEQAHAAGKRLFEYGPVRVKPVRATGGHGQKVAMSMSELEEIIAFLDPADLIAGIVLEQNLVSVTTSSVGQVLVGDLTAAYFGSQRLTADNGGKEVYGGSEIVVVRGTLETLLALDLPKELRVAVAQACAYDAATACLPGMFASRRNYDVAQGLDATGSWRSGVLEQSWRVGGATGAEIAALEAFRADPGLRMVRASTREIYGESEPPPPHATLYFRGVDARIGPLTKYALVEAP
jgi:hypothetical protein